ncbi:class I ribonucleotide reductase maintenance protein YfaE [Necropsobacter rosorum]|uniref:class I ribonucleotide reductase maintenance protein YfaE n=1 Tax=Necropsobacter rosorum TaxID=908285 RepID=UPI000509D678
MKIHLLHSNRIIEHDNDIPLLNRLEQHSVCHEYQCRSGYCGSCRVKIRKGKVSYKETPLAFLNPDEILLCCCRVEEDLEIEL